MGRLVFTALVTGMRPRKWPAARWDGSFAIACRESPRPGFGDCGPLCCHSGLTVPADRVQ